MEKSFDTAVLMLFFIRSDTFGQVFEAVRKAKPKRLYLFQDGPRPDRPDDIEKIMNCRKICENIDWDCEVFRNYQEKNLGCDTSQFTAFSWGFENEEKLIILEDDVVPSKSFFYFCDEMLEKYKDDKEIFMICGRNQLGETNYGDGSYFFAKAASIWGWASWRDRWALCDYKHSFLNDPKLVKKVRSQAPNLFDGKQFIKRCERHREKATDTFIPSFESPLRAALYIDNCISIVPNKNLIKNVGITGDSAHTAVGVENFSKVQRKIYLIDALELDFPLIHPTDRTPNNKFLIERLKLLGCDNPFRYYYRKAKGFLKRKVFCRKGK